MIDLTPLDVRKKRGDFGKGVRGYNVQEVDSFLELVAERLEEVVKENITLRERVDRLAEQVTAQTGRERAVHEALVTAQQLREEIQENARREAELITREAESRAQDIVGEAERKAVDRAESLHELERRRKRFLASFRKFLERELDAVTVEEGQEPLKRSTVIEMDLGGGRAVGLDPRPEDDVHSLAADGEEPFDLDAARAAGERAAADETAGAPPERAGAPGPREATDGRPAGAPERRQDAPAGDTPLTDGAGDDLWTLGPEGVDAAAGPDTPDTRPDRS